MDTPAGAVRALAALLEGSEVALLELRRGTEVIRLTRGRSAPAAPGAAPPPGNETPVPAPHAGIVRLAHPLRDAPLVQPGERVRAGDPVALLQVGALLRAVPAPHDGVVASCDAADGALVGYGTVLLRLRTRAEGED